MSCTFVEIDCPGEQVEIHTVSDALIVAECRQGPAGPPGAGGQQPADMPIAPSDTEIVDSLPVATYAVAKWIVHIITDEGTPRYQAKEVLGMYNGSTGFHNITGTVGDTIDTGIVADLNGSNLELQVTNNEAVDITVRVLRLEVTWTP